MSSITLPQRLEDPPAATGGRGSECSAVCMSSPRQRRGRRGGGAGLSWVGRAGGQAADKSPADPSHGSACRRAGLVQTQRLTQPAGKVHCFHLGPLDEGVVLQGNERRRERPGVCGEEEGTSLPLGSSRPSGTKTRKTEREQAPSHRKTHSGRGEKPNPEQGGATPGASNTWGLEHLGQGLRGG